MRMATLVIAAALALRPLAYAGEAAKTTLTIEG